jgi:hypothetical protein
MQLALALTAILFGPAVAAQKPEPVVLTQAGEQLQARYEAELAALRAAIAKAVPVPEERGRAALQQASEAVKLAQTAFEAAQKDAAKVQDAKALVEHAKNKWLGGAAKGIASAEAARKAATTDAEREQAHKDLAHWQANREAGLKALAERQAALDVAKVDEAKHAAALAAATAALATARATELSAANALLAGVGTFLSSDRLDATLVKCVVLAEGTPRRLAAFAQGSRERAVLLDRLFGDAALMREMLVAGGASGGAFGRAMEIHGAIRGASAKARDGALQRLALATALEHAVPIEQSNAVDATSAQKTVDPVQRYLHYERAFLAGELDAAFADLTTWEYRMVVGCDAPDEILAWGREMLRAYRPDHVTTVDHGWRYVAAVRTDVSYGSQNVGKDRPTLHQYQNIPLNGGVCGRRAFFGRFILRAFGIPVWGVTQHKHAAVSHWTPKGWVVNLGAGFHASWWDKGDEPRSGAEFLLETQAREHDAEYLKALRARWVSRALGEPACNERKKVAGGFWSNIARHQTIALASKSVALGPLGKELAEANEKKERLDQVAATESDRKIVTGPAGIVIPAVAHQQPTGASATMNSHGGGQQLHCKGGYRAQLVLEAPQAGRYALTARIATLGDGQQLEFTVNDRATPVAASVPFTIGLWQQTKPVELTLTKGRNIITVSLPNDSRGVTVKDFTLNPAK